MQYDQHIYEKALLLSKYAQGVLTSEEQVEFDKWLEETPENGALARRLKETDTVHQAYQLLSTLDTGAAWDRIMTKAKGYSAPNPSEFPASRGWWDFKWYYAAAAAVVIIGFTLVPWKSKVREQSPLDTAISHVTAHEPVLSLGDGKEYKLKQLPEGHNSLADGTALVKSGDTLRYAGAPRSRDGHTISTPVGTRYKLVLADNTHVWLNAASSIRYHAPDEKEGRIVLLTGEAYFEVASLPTSAADDSKIPFRVITDKASIEVTGTSFNVNSFSGFPLRATLVEGAIHLKTAEKEVRLMPGQQGTVENGLRVATVDTDEITAWKDGYFQFENKPLIDVLSELQRWYGFRLDPNSEFPPKRFTASISRDQSLETVLRMLELSGEVAFDLHGNTLKIKQTLLINQHKK